MTRRQLPFLTLTFALILILTLILAFTLALAIHRPPPITPPSHRRIGTDAREFVYLSVMDFLPANAYSINATCGNGEGVVWWPALVDALTTAATANGCDVKILVSWWASSHAVSSAGIRKFTV